MIHIGDITKINGAEIEPVDVITGGSPCQDLSVAGKRAGLAGERSGLFMEMVRVIKEMKDATKQLHMQRPDIDIRPRFVVWENVYGAFTSNRGAISQRSWKSFQNLPQKQTFQFLDLRTESGQSQGVLSAIIGALHGAEWTLVCGECPSVVRESRLSWILQDNAPPKYFLSARACQGILNRAEKRLKHIPELLRKVLEQQILRK